MSGKGYETNVMVPGSKGIEKDYNVKCPECKGDDLRISKEFSRRTTKWSAVLKCKKCGCVFSVKPAAEKPPESKDLYNEEK